MNVAQLADRLQSEVDRHAAPGVSVAIRHNGSLTTFVAGTANNRTGLPVTRDTLFQVGSIAKVYTATLVLRLVDEGLLDLDEKVGTYLPDAPWDVTVAQLLDHTSGLAADVLDDFGRGADSVTRYVDHLRGLPFEHPVGAFYSYTNSGPILAGRVVEAVTGQPFDQVLRDRLLLPLGATTTFNAPEEVMLHPFAVGHLESGDVVPLWTISHACAPAGSLLCAPAHEVLLLAQLHLSDGIALDGTRLLSSAAVAEMRTWRADIPEVAPRKLGIGLGWHLEGIDGRLLLSHGGSTYGGRSLLLAVPDSDLAVVVLANTGDADTLIDEVSRLVLAELAGLTRPARGTDRGTVTPQELARCEGAYECSSIRAVITATATGLVAALEPVGLPPEVAAQAEVQTVPLAPLGDDRFLLDQPGLTAPGGVVLAFLEPDADGQPQYLSMGRTLRRQVA